jgi:xanthine dehydrogenase accessory factor
MSIYSSLADMVRQGRAVSLATVVKSEAAEAPVGAKLLLPGDGSQVVGSIHSELDGDIAGDARRLLGEERSETIAYRFSGGTIEVFIQTFPPPQQVVIVGAVHIAIPLSKMAKMLGYAVTVIDPRGVFATAARFPEADRLVVEWPEDAFKQLELNTSTSVVVLTHDPKLDLPATFAALQSPARYVGAIGSRGTTAQRKIDLAEMGATEEQLSRIHSPIGLKIGSRSPAEIALAIMAEIVATRRVQG